MTRVYDSLANRALGMAFVPASVAGLNTSLRRWLDFCAEMSVPPLEQATPEAIKRFVGYLLSHQLAPSRFIYALNVSHRMRGLTPLWESAVQLPLLARGALRLINAPHKHKPALVKGPSAPFRPAYALQAAALVRDWHTLTSDMEAVVVALIASATLLRFKSVRLLTVGDVRPGRDITELWDFEAKTDRFFQGQPHYLRGSVLPVAPFNVLTRWMRLAHPQPDPNAPLFPDLATGQPLTNQQLTRMVRGLVTRLADQVDPARTPGLCAAPRYDYRSFRYGGAVALLEAGFDHTIIMLEGRWKSAAFMGYLRSVWFPWQADRSDICRALFRLH